MVTVDELEEAIEPAPSSPAVGGSMTEPDSHDAGQDSVQQRGESGSGGCAGVLHLVV